MKHGIFQTIEIRSRYRQVGTETLAACVTGSDAEIITVLSREAKKRREAIDAYAAANRPDLVAKEKSESEVIAAYLPEPLSDNEIEKLIKEAINETGASGPAAMGQVMKLLQPKIAGRADGGKVSGLVKKALGN